jgi:hypothetical protein
MKDGNEVRSSRVGSVSEGRVVGSERLGGERAWPFAGTMPPAIGRPSTVALGESPPLLPRPRQPHMPIQLPVDEGCFFSFSMRPAPAATRGPLIDLALERPGEALLVAGVEAVDAVEAAEATDASVEIEPSRGCRRSLFPLPASSDSRSAREEEGELRVCREEDDSEWRLTGDVASVVDRAS